MTTYQDYEESNAAGELIELYDFYDEFGHHWRVTTCEDTFTYDGYDYEPSAIERSEVEITGTEDIKAVKFTLPRGFDLTNHFVSAPIEGLVHVVCYRCHVDGSNDAIFWSGLLSNVTFDGNSVPVCNFAPPDADTPRTGCRRCNQILCGKALYSQGAFGCRVDPNNFVVTGTIANISGTTVVASIFGTKPDGWFIPGELVVGDARRLIKGHSGTSIIINRPMLNAIIGNSLTAYAGCDHTGATCYTKFNNKHNYGGNEFLPSKNPYTRGIRY